MFACFGVGQVTAQAFEWEPRSPIPEARWGASTFVIDSTAYVVGGRSGSLDRVDMFAYDLGSDTWTEKAPIPAARRLAASFALNGKGYVSCGLVGSSTKLNDLWEYDPVADSWTVRAPLPGQARVGTYHFAVGDLGYVGGGNIGNADGPFVSDAYRFDPVSNTWSSAVPLPDLARSGTSSFVMNGKGYVFGGKESSLAFSPDLWVFDPIAQGWELMPPFPGTPRSSPLAFVLANDAVIGCGRTGTINLYDVWLYDPFSNDWESAPNYPGESSLAGTSFSINGRAFGGLGWVLETNESASDLWELVKPGNNGLDELNSAVRIACQPNPIRAGDQLVLAGHKSPIISVTLHDCLGRFVWTGVAYDGRMIIPSDLSGSIQLTAMDGAQTKFSRIMVLPN
jgi:N-acetylneuraminic acid mutarotase